MVRELAEKPRRGKLDSYAHSCLEMRIVYLEYSSIVSMMLLPKGNTGDPVLSQSVSEGKGDLQRRYTTLHIFNKKSIQG